VVIGIVWQVSLVALPCYVVIQKSHAVLIAGAIIAATSLILKFTWYDHLKAMEAREQAKAQPLAA
jgi:hypothetical protein